MMREIESGIGGGDNEVQETLGSQSFEEQRKLGLLFDAKKDISKEDWFKIKDNARTFYGRNYVPGIVRSPEEEVRSYDKSDFARFCALAENVKILDPSVDIVDGKDLEAIEGCLEELRSNKEWFQFSTLATQRKILYPNMDFKIDEECQKGMRDDFEKYKQYAEGMDLHYSLNEHRGYSFAIVAENLKILDTEFDPKLDKQTLENIRAGIEEQKKIAKESGNWECFSVLVRQMKIIEPTFDTGMDMDCYQGIKDDFNRRQLEVGEYRFAEEVSAMAVSLKVICSEKVDFSNKPEVFSDEYEPFDAREELKTLKKLLKNDKTKVSRKELLKDFKEKLIDQKLGIAETISDLKGAALHNPDLSEDEFWEKVVIAAKKFKFSEEQLDYFQDGIVEYHKKHLAVEEFREKYPDDTDFFQACFGKKPKGKVDIIKGPMTLLFRCYDADDYAFVYSFYKHKGNFDVETEDFEKSKTSGGVALREIKILELVGAVTAENVLGNDPEYKQVENVEQKDLLIEKQSSFVLDAVNSDIDIDYIGVAKYKIKVEKDEKTGQPVAIKVFDYNLGADAEPESFTLTSKEGDNPDKSRPQIYLKYSGENGGEENVRSITRLVKDSSGKSVGSISLNGNTITFSAGSEGAILKYKQPGLQIQANERNSRSVRAHEDQHQFENLFQPLMVAISSPNIKNISETGKIELKIDGKEVIIDIAKETVLRFIRKQREYMGIDSRARGEILAYYRDGHSADDIFNIVSESKLYDYKNQDYYQEKIEAIPKDVDEIEGIYFSLNPKQIKSLVDKVFGEDYKADLKKWVDVIKKMEKKGYSRENIISLLYQEESIQSWPNLVRRLP